MSESQTIPVRTEFDVFMARMHVRTLARAAGFDITDQACIALATSSLARALRLGEVYQGEVNVDCLGDGGNSCVRVVCTAIKGAGSNLASRTFTDTRWLVDELTIEETPPNNLQVTVVKWVTRGDSYA
jgi:hypothetical protein